MYKLHIGLTFELFRYKGSNSLQGNKEGIIVKEIRMLCRNETHLKLILYNGLKFNALT